MKLSDGCFRLSSFYDHFEKTSKAIIKTLNLLASYIRWRLFTQMLSLQSSADIYNFMKRLVVAVEQLSNQEIIRLVVNTFWKQPNEG